MAQVEGGEEGEEEERFAGEENLDLKPEFWVGFSDGHFGGWGQQTGTLIRHKIPTFFTNTHNTIGNCPGLLSSPHPRSHAMPTRPT